MAGMVDLVIIIVIGVIAIQFLPGLLQNLDFSQLSGAVGGTQNNAMDMNSGEPVQMKKAKKVNNNNQANNNVKLKKEGNSIAMCVAAGASQACCQQAMNRGNNIGDYEVRNCIKCGKIECKGGGKKGNVGYAYYVDYDDDF